MVMTSGMRKARSKPIMSGVAPASRVSKRPAEQAGIQAFAKVRKEGLRTVDVGKSDLAVSRKKRKYVGDGGLESGYEAEEENTTKKPKIAVHEIDDACQELGHELCITKVSQEKAEQSRAGIITTGKAKHCANLLETPTKGTRSRLERFGLSSPPEQSNTRKSPSSPSPTVKPQDATPSSSPPSIHHNDLAIDDPQRQALGPENESKLWARMKVVERVRASRGTEPVSLPQDLQDLVILGYAFLTTLSLHFAHHGSINPVDLRDILPNITRTWKKRAVDVEDIRRLTAVMNNKFRDIFTMCDYGHGKICLEVRRKMVSMSTGRIIRAERFGEALADHLTRQWAREMEQNTTTPSISNIIAQLPLLPIKKCTPATLNIFAKGQRRLEDLKAGAIKAQERALTPTSANASSRAPNPNESEPSKPKSAGTRTSALLDRLHAKALHQSTLKAPPSPEQVARRRALQRLPEIAPVISGLLVGGQKHNNDDTDESKDFAWQPKAVNMSFTMPTMIQHFQMSLRNPIAVDEAVRCIRCLAEAVPEWIGVKDMGRLCVVTVRGDGVGRIELERRVQGLLDKE